MTTRNEEPLSLSGGCRETPQGGQVELGCSASADPAAATLEKKENDK